MNILEIQPFEVDVIETAWDYIIGGSTVLLAMVNLVLVYFIYKWQTQDFSEKEEKQRRIQQFNNIFLIPRLDFLKKTFEKLDEIALEFENCRDDEEKKSASHDKFQNSIEEFNNKFVSFLPGIDSKLSMDVKECVEGLSDGLSVDVFDSDTKKISGSEYVQKLQLRISNSYKTLLKILFSYNATEVNENKKDAVRPLVWLAYLMGVVALSLVLITIRTYTINPPTDGVTIQLDSLQMKNFLEHMNQDSKSSCGGDSLPALVK